MYRKHGYFNTYKQENEQLQLTIAQIILYCIHTLGLSLADFHQTNHAFQCVCCL